MAWVKTANDEPAEISTSVLKMARKRRDPRVSGSTVSEIHFEVLGLGKPAILRSVEGKTLGSRVINIAAERAGGAWSIGWTGGRELINLIGQLKKGLPELVQTYLLRRGTRAGTLHGNAHRDFMLNALDDAKHSVCILSGWLSKRVVDAEFMQCVSEAISRGVDVFLGYGYEYQRGHQEKGDSKMAMAVLRTAAQDAFKASRPGSLTVGKFATHEKVLLVDCSVIVTGSNNWLSNSSHLNDESSLIVEDGEIAKKECLRVKKSITKHAIVSSEQPDVE